MRKNYQKELYYIYKEKQERLILILFQKILIN